MERSIRMIPMILQYPMESCVIIVAISYRSYWVALPNIMVNFYSEIRIGRHLRLLPPPLDPITNRPLAEEFPLNSMRV